MGGLANLARPFLLLRRSGADKAWTPEEFAEKMCQ
jgi:hypothetical protein